MPDEGGADLLALRCDAVADLDEAAVRDALEYFGPDLVYVVRESSDVRVVSRVRRAADSPVVAAAGPAEIRTETVAGISFCFAGSTSLLADAPAADYLVCDDLEPTTDAVALEATLAGREAAARYRSRSSREPTFLTGALPASYDHVWEGAVDGESVRLPVRGLAPLERSGAAELACLTCGRAGSVAVSSVPADRFGLGALSGVGPTTARRLRKNGYETRAAVADAAATALSSIDGLGPSTAREIVHSARALADGRVVRTTADPLPPAGDATPLFVDIETDGLQPTTIPLIGVYDPASDDYVDFVDTAPSREDPGRATREFVSWLAAEYDAPSLVAWNGHGFDYDHLERFIARYTPEYRAYWHDHVATYDPYDWAVRRGNAVLPGRTNRLEDVAAALGRDREGAAATLDGKTFAERLRRLLEGSSESEAPTIDWTAARRYCEADVRELAAVYEAIAVADPKPTDPAGARPANEPTQTGLTDF
ncbi:DNA-binding protein [Natrinema mahii]|nr:DNA-binding protein [Natrinema mahii]